MASAKKQRISWQSMNASSRSLDQKSRAVNGVKNTLLGLFRFVIIVGISYVILAPVIGIIAHSFFSRQDSINPMVFTVPINPTLERYTMAVKYLDYLPILGRTLLYVFGVTLIQLLICSMVGYGFARYQFPLKKLLFGCVVVMIVVPLNTIQFPLYMGLRSGLYIYIFNQFFRGLPKEIEEAALVDGAGSWYTYFHIMLPNAAPALITVAVFSIVWQYNDSFFANTFNISDSIILTRKLDSLINVIANAEKILTISEQQLYFDAGVVLVLLPVVIIYLVLQRRFIEGVERSGIVG